MVNYYPSINYDMPRIAKEFVVTRAGDLSYSKYVESLIDKWYASYIERKDSPFHIDKDGNKKSRSVFQFSRDGDRKLLELSKKLGISKASLVTFMAYGFELKFDEEGESDNA